MKKSFQVDVTAQVNGEPVNVTLKEHAIGAGRWRYREAIARFHEWAEIFNTEFSLDLQTPAIQITGMAVSRLGTYCPDRNGFGLKHQVTLNAKHLNRPLAEQLETLLHELLHQWQTLWGRSGKNNYHNKEFRVKARSYGLIVDERGRHLGVVRRFIYDNAELNAPDDATLRLFTFGVGYDVNTILLDTLSKEMGGRSTYVLPEERIDEAVSAFYQGISMPVLTNVSLEVEGDAVIDEIYPYPLPDLFAGEQLVVVGRYRNGGEVSMHLTGIVNGQSQEFRFDAMTLRDRGGEHFVARVWASRKIGVLMEQIRRSGPDPEVIDAIVELSLQYGIVTPYTAYLVQEPDNGVISPMPGAPTTAIPADGTGGGSPVEMAPAARAYAADEAQAMAAAPASGEAAVAASEAQNDMQVATSVQNTESAKFVAGKTFVQQGWVSTPDGSSLPFWVDTAFKQEMSISWVEFASDDYFILTQQPSMAAWLAVGQEMVIVVSDIHAIRVTTNVEEMQRQGNAPLSPLETPAVSDEDTPSDSTANPEANSEAENQSAWDAFWSWVWGE